jgi:hypothetical protein
MTSNLPNYANAMHSSRNQSTPFSLIPMRANTIAQTSFFGKITNSIDRIYYNFSIEFWLFIVSASTLANLILNYGITSISIGLSMFFILAIYLARSIHSIDDVWSKAYKGIKLSRKSLPLLTLFTVLGGLFWIATVAETAQALIVTTSGVTPITNLINGTTLTGAANAQLNTFAGGVILIIKLIFALLFVFALYDAYQKYKERAEFQEIIQSPVVLFLVVLAIDGGMTVFFGP